VADIVELIRADHARIRQLFAKLGDVPQRPGGLSPGQEPGEVWASLADMLELHADVAEEICYLSLFEGPAQSVRDIGEAVAEHADIREAVRETRLHPPGSHVWWLAVQAAREAAFGHIERIESGALSRFERRAPPAAREALGLQWVAFADARARDAAERQGRGAPSVSVSARWDPLAPP
jgi:hypothetical protein